ncbi:MAG TPA: serpin family protein, partial [Bacteroidales bacterium]
IYFKGSWQFSFDKSKTQTADFYLNHDAKVDHSQMMLQTQLNYSSNNTFSAIELPYGNGTFNFVILLPAYDKTVDDIINGLSSQQWKETISSMTKSDVVVKMPKFKLECEGLLNNPLKSMGMTTAFTGAADFSKITTDAGLFISRVIHKTFIDLNEEGTEAAAVTAVEMKFTSTGGETNTTKWFIANQPFVYAITEKSTGAILFIGKMLNPTEEKTKFTE